MYACQLQVLRTQITVALVSCVYIMLTISYKIWMQVYKLMSKKFGHHGPSFIFLASLYSTYSIWSDWSILSEKYIIFARNGSWFTLSFRAVNWCRSCWTTVSGINQSVKSVPGCVRKEDEWALMSKAYQSMAHKLIRYCKQSVVCNLIPLMNSCWDHVHPVQASNMIGLKL